MNGRTNTTSVTEVVEGVQVALEAPTNLVLTPLNARVDLTWTDPVDKYAADSNESVGQCGNLGSFHCGPESWIRTYISRRWRVDLYGDYQEPASVHSL